MVDAKRWCVVCGQRPVRAVDRCEICYPYWRLNGYDRSEELIVRDAVRKFEQQAETDVWGGPAPAPLPSEGQRLRDRAEEAARERRERKRREQGG